MALLSPLFLLTTIFGVSIIYYITLPERNDYVIRIMYIALLLLYAFAVTMPIPSIVVAMSSILLFLCLYRRYKLKASKTTALLQLMCLSIPLSWRNIMGGDYSDLPVTWFYIFGLFLAIHLLSIRKDIKLSKSNFTMVLFLAFSVFFSVIPLILTHKGYVNQGLSQFVILTFHSVILIIVVSKGRFLSSDQIKTVEKSYVTAGVATSIGLIVQFILFRSGITIGIIDFYLNRQSFHFLISDVSHASLYLATTAFLSIQMMNEYKGIKKLRAYVIPIIILVGAAITSARTGLVAFAIIYMLYIFVGQKGFKRKFLSLLLGIIAMVAAYHLYKGVRQQSSLKEILFDTSDRGNGYSTAYHLFLHKPLFGYGFSVDYLAEIMHQPIPHLSFLQYMVHGGIFYALMLFGIIGASYLYARKYKMNESWLIMLTVTGTCLIPDIFSTRYITLLMVLVFMKSISAETEMPDSIETNSVGLRTVRNLT